MMNHMILLEMEETYMVELNQSKVISYKLVWISPLNTAWQSNMTHCLEDHFNIQIILTFACFPLFSVKIQVN